MNIPRELTDLRQWCCWKTVDGQKIPITPSGGVFRSNDPATFATFDEAVSSGRPIAFVIQGDDPYTGIDLDNCIDADGQFLPWAYPIIARLDGLAYAEISPSGRGMKFLTRAKKPSGARCVKKIGENKQQIEVYDFNRFWTITQNVYASNKSIGDGQVAVDAICKLHLIDAPAASAGNLSDIDLSVVSQPTSMPLEFRAEKYADSVPATGEGGRNNSAFSLAGHLLSMEDEIGKSLSIDQVGEIVLRWNSRLADPLPPKEVERAVRSAAKNGIKRDPKPPPEATLRVVEKTPPMPRPSIPDDILRPPGIIADVIDYTLKTSLYPQPELALAGAIALMGVITGRKLTDAYTTRTNVYIIGLAPSGSGKEQARKVNKLLLAMAGAEGQKMIGPERIGSSAGLVTHIGESPAILFQLDEMGRMLSTLKNPAKSPHLYNIATVLMQIYGCSDTIWIGDAYADAKKTKMIDQPHPVIYGTAVPEGFWESLTAENVTDGLLGRMMPFESAKGYVDPQTPSTDSPPADLVDRIRYWIDLKPGTGNLRDQTPQAVVAEHSEAARQRFDDHMAEIASRRRSEDNQAAALWSRSAGKAGKLALIFAASRQPFEMMPIVELEDVDRAVRLSNWITRTIQKQVFEHVSANDQEDRTKKVYRLLTTPMTKSQITRKTQWLARRERGEILETLIEAGLVEVESEETPGGGPPKTIFRQVRDRA